MNKGSSFQKKLFTRLFWVLNAIAIPLVAQNPEVKSIRTSAAPSEIISIKGENFGTDDSKLVVSFGGVKGVIQTPINNQLLEVKVPSSSTYGPISVTNTTLGRTGYSKDNFLLSYGGTHPFDVANLRPQQDFQASSGLFDLCLCDISNDGKPEVFTTVEKALQTTTDQFNNTSTPGTIAMSAPSSKTLQFRSIHVKCGDLNGDGRPDQVFSEGGSGNRIAIYTTSSGSPTQTYTLTGRQTKRIEIADLDLDGRPEIIVGDQNSNTISVLVNQSTTSTLSFTVQNIIIGNSINTDALAVSDLNGDGLPDIIASQYQTNSSVFILQNISTPGNIKFNDGPTGTISLPLGTAILNIKAGDLDGDGKPEIAVTEFLNKQVTIFPNQSTTSISFGSPTKVLVEDRPWGLDFGDLDGDGKSEIVVTHTSTKALVILSNESTPGNLVFQKLPPITTNYITKHISITDVDGDGKPDIAFTSVDDGQLSIPASKLSFFRNASCMTPKISPDKAVTVCINVPVKLTSTESNGSTYEWKKAGANVGTTSTYDVPTAAVSPASDYTVTMTSEGGSCVKTSTPISVSIDNGSITGTPSATNSGPVCAGSTLELKINAVGDKYRWTDPSGTVVYGSPDGGTDLIATVTNFQLKNAGRYKVEIFKGSCVAAEATTVVGVVDVPNFTINAGGNIFCTGETKTLSIAPVVSGFTYQWHEKTGGAISGATNSTYSVTATGEYFVKASFAGCTDVTTQAVQLTAAIAPTAAFDAPTTACAGQIVQFTNQSTLDPNLEVFYAWTFGDGESTDKKSPTHRYSAAGSRSVKLKVNYTGGSCAKEIAKSIDVQAAPVIDIRTAGNVTSFCPGDKLKLTVPTTGLPATTTYSWNTSETTSSIEVTEKGIYKVIVTVGICPLTDSIEVQTYPVPQITATANPSTIREGESSTLSAEGSEIASYSWSPIETLNNTNTKDPIATPLEDTMYKVTAKDKKGCIGEASVQVLVIQDRPVDKLGPRAFFSPNGDNDNNTWEVNQILNYPICEVAVYDEKGVKVFEAKPYLNNWDGTFNGKRLPDGVYYFIIRCDGDARSGSITLLR